MNLRTFDFDVNCKPNRAITWREEWVWDYESPWSVFEKIKCINSATDTEMYLLFGTEDAKQKSVRGRYWGDRCLKRMDSLSSSAIRAFLGLDLKETNTSNLKSILCFLPNIYPYDELLLRDEVTYCPKCIEHGYHSIFHQIKLINECPFHYITLESKCPNCLKKIPYKLTNSWSEAPFTCSCGYRFCKGDNHIEIIKKWSKNNETKITLPALSTWLQLKDSQKKVLRSISLNIKMVKYHYSDLIGCLLTLVNEGSQKNNYYKHKSKSFDKSQRLLYPSKNYPKSDFSTGSINMEIFELIWATFRRIEQFVLRFLKINHSGCLNEDNNSTEYARKHSSEKCPYVYAYNLWLKSVKRFEYYFNLRNEMGGISWYKNSYFNEQDEVSMLDDFYFELKNNLCWIDSSNIRLYKWIFNIFNSFVLISHYFNLMKHVESYFMKGQLVPEYPLLYKNVPFHIIKYPSSESTQLEFHWWVKKHNEKKE